MNDMLVLETMHWTGEIGSARFGELGKSPRIQNREPKMARQLITQMGEDFDPSDFRDDYHRALKKLIDKKIRDEEVERRFER